MRSSGPCLADARAAEWELCEGGEEVIGGRIRMPCAA